MLEHYRVFAKQIKSFPLKATLSDVYHGLTNHKIAEKL